MSSTTGTCVPCASGDHGHCSGQCGCGCLRGAFAPDTPMPARSRTKALHRHNETMHAKGNELARAVHALAAAGSEAEADLWHRASNLAADFERISDPSGEERQRWKVDDDYACRATKPSGGEVVFDDLLKEGELVGLGDIPEDAEDRDGRPPYGRVIRDAGGLWIVPLTEAEERERSLRLLRASSKEVGGDGDGE